jgi:surfactin family lipopeptide synthetase A
MFNNNARTDLLRRENIDDVYPMSDIQLGMVYHSLREPGAATYHNQAVYQRRDENFSRETLEKALGLMVEKHPVLRTGFNMSDFKEPLQIVFKEISLNYRHHDLTGQSTREQEEFVRSVAAEDRGTPFSLSAPEPLWRMWTFALDAKTVFFLWSCHHAITDGWSTASLMTELQRTYLKLKSDPGYMPAKLKNSYKQFVLEQRLEKENERNITFWREELAGYKRLEFPGNWAAGDRSPRRKAHVWDLGSERLQQLKRCAHRYDTSLKNLCFAAYFYMLNMLSYDGDITAGLVTGNRPVCEDGDKIIGCFLNTVPVRVKIPGSIAWSHFISLVNRKLRELADYNRLPLMEIVNIAGVKSRDRNPIFDTLFNFVDFHIYSQVDDGGKAWDGAGDGGKKLAVGGNEVTNTLFNCDVTTTAGCFYLTLTYLETVMDEELALNLGGYYQRILEKFIHAPGELACKQDLFSPVEKERLLETFNRTRAGFPADKTIVQLFEEQVEKNCDRTAVICLEPGDGNQGRCLRHVLTYGELNSRAGRLAGALREQGVRPDDIAAIMVERSPAMIIGIMGILKAGAAYLPIDPAYPRDRRDFMMADSQAKILLTADSPEFFSSSLPLSVTGYPANLAYVIYTSGSTGRPKGVMIEHRSLVNRLHWMQGAYPLDERGALLQKTPFTFDVSVWELLWWAVTGARVCFLSPGGEKDPARIVDAVESEGVTVLHFVPSMLTLFLDHVESFAAAGRLAGLEQVIASGEALLPAQVQRFARLLYRPNNTRLANLYGPTEAAIDVSYYDCDLQREIGGVPIGKPIDNTAFYVVDSRLEPAPRGVAGELCIAGVGLARGYLNRPPLTSERFCLSGLPGKSRRMIGARSRKSVYRTGDLVRWLPDGNLEFIGRIDHQVKIRGNRIELGEITARLLEHEDIDDAAVTVRMAGGGGDKALVAYIVSGREFDVSQLRDHLVKKLPGYMVPAHFMQIDRIPLTANGKLDRAALDSCGQAVGTGKEQVEPSGEMENIAAAAWKEVLKIDKVGIYDNFFDLGGDSVKVIKLNNRLNNAFGTKIPVAKMFQYLTISSFVDYLKAEESEERLQCSEEHRADAIDRGKRKRQDQRARRRKIERINA